MSLDKARERLKAYDFPPQSWDVDEARDEILAELDRRGALIESVRALCLEAVVGPAQRSLRPADLLADDVLLILDGKPGAKHQTGDET
jgi:hypothetical protein